MYKSDQAKKIALLYKSIRLEMYLFQNLRVFNTDPWISAVVNNVGIANIGSSSLETLQKLWE